MNTTIEKTVGEIVAEDYRAAAIFAKHGIDFCCKGNTPISEACDKKNIEMEAVMEDIYKLTSNTTDQMSEYNTWSAQKLIDHIEEKHHRYVEEKTPVILQFLDKLCKVHGQRHPELYEVFQLFKQSAADLSQHMKKEELILFPLIRNLSAELTADDQNRTLRSGTVQSPIALMMHEHETEGDRFREIEKLTDHYRVPSDGCTTYKVAYQMLQEFVQDLHLHIHLENNILFPLAANMEKELLN